MNDHEKEDKNKSRKNFPQKRRESLNHRGFLGQKVIDANGTSIVDLCSCGRTKHMMSFISPRELNNAYKKTFLSTSSSQKPEYDLGEEVTIFDESEECLVVVDDTSEDGQKDFSLYFTCTRT